MITIEMEAGASAVSINSVEKRKSDMDRHYSNETFYTDSSDEAQSKCKSSTINTSHKRRHPHALLGSSNPYRRSSNCVSRVLSLNTNSKNNMSACAQKILSARVLRVKQLQNELTEAQFQLNELSTENRVLRTMQKRQDVMLKRYEGTQAELPRLIHSHNEEVRTLTSKLKQAKSQCRSLEEKLRTRDAELAALREKYHHLVELSKNRHLREREQLQQQLEHMQDLVREQDKKLQMLTRKVMLEGKNYKHQLATEIARHKEACSELNVALERISKLETLLESRDKYIATNMPRPVSLLSLHPPARFRGYQIPCKSIEENAQQNIRQGERLDDQGSQDGEEQGDVEDEESNEDEQKPVSDSVYNVIQSHIPEISSGSQSTGKITKNDVDFQVKHLQFGNRFRKNVNPLKEKLYNESTSGHSSSLSPESHLGESEIDTDTTSIKNLKKLNPLIRKTSFQAEMENLIENSKTDTSVTDADDDALANARRIVASRRGSLTVIGDLRKKEKKKEDASFMSTLISEMEKESFKRGSPLKGQDKLDDCHVTGSPQDNSTKVTINWETKYTNKDSVHENIKKGSKKMLLRIPDESETHLEQDKEGIINVDHEKPYLDMNYSKTNESQNLETNICAEDHSTKDVVPETYGIKSNVRNTFINNDMGEPNNESSMDNLRLHLKNADSWGQAQDTQTDKTKLMGGKQMVYMNDIGNTVAKCNKEALLAALKAIDQGGDPVDVSVLQNGVGSKLTSNLLGTTSDNSSCNQSLFQLPDGTLSHEDGTGSIINETKSLYLEDSSGIAIASSNTGFQPKRRVHLMEELFGNKTDNTTIRTGSSYVAQ